MDARLPQGTNTARGLGRDVAVVLAVTVVCAVLAIRFQWAEVLFAWTRRSESLQLDELTFVLLSLATGCAWIAARRWWAARQEIRARIHAESQLAHTLEEQRQLRRHFVDVQESERKRLSRELHDELGQYINAIKLDAVAIRAVARGTDPGHPDLAARSESIIANSDLMHESVARLIGELRPVGLDELGLTAAIEHCVDSWRTRLLPTAVAATVDERIDRLNEARTLTIYRMVQEGLANCSRYAQASRISIVVTWQDASSAEHAAARVVIEDDGIGPAGASVSTGLGLIGMRERINALGGSLAVDARPGAGFRLSATIPVDPAGTSAP
jgi:signal transduction histidine kinase